MKPRVLLIDFSNVAYTCFFNALTRSGLKPDNVPANFREYLNAFHERVSGLQQANLNAPLFFALDSFPKWKRELYPEYKSKRKPMDFNPKPGCLELIRSWSCQTIEAEDTEADDLIATFVARYWNTYEIVVITTDKDLWQILDHKVRLFNFHSNIFIDIDKLRSEFDLDTYAQIRLYKTLWGDSSDNVPNAVPRMHKHLLPLVRATDGSLEQFWQKVEDKKKDLSARCIELLEQNRNQIEINYKLVTLSYDCQMTFRAWPQQPVYSPVSNSF